MTAAPSSSVSHRAGPGWRSWARSLACPALLFVILTCFYWRLVFTYEYDWVWGPDLTQQVLPWFEEEARQMQHGILPLWDPHAWGGQPLLGQAQPGAAYPLNWLLFLFPRQHGHINMLVLQWYYIVVRYMAALFCYLLCRDLGASRFASVVGGLIFALAAYVGTTGWPQMVNGAVWAPLVFLFLLRAVRGYRPLLSAAACGVCWGVSFLSGHHQVPTYISLAALFTWAFYILREKRINWRLAGLAAIAVAFMIFAGGLQILPAEEYGHLAKRWAGAQEPLAWNQRVPYYVHQQYSTSVVSLLGILFPGMHNNADPFLGVVVFGLALAAIATAWRRPGVKLFSALAIGGIVYALGFNSVFQGFLYSVMPMVDKARTPSMAVIILGFAAAVLAALGIDELPVLRDSAWGRRLNIGLFVFGALVWTLILGAAFTNHGVWTGDERLGIPGIAALLMAALLYGWRSGNLTQRQTGVLLTLLLLFELGNVSGMQFADRNDAGQRSYAEKVWSNGDIADYLNQQAKPFRVEVDEAALAPNWGEYYNFDSVKTYTAGLTTNVLDLEFHSPNTRKLYGVQYTIGRKPEFPDAKDVYEGASGLKVFYNPSAFPRVWAAHEIVPVKNKDDVVRFISEHVDELRWKALAMGTLPSLRTCDVPDDISIARNRADFVAIRGNMGCDGMVVLSDTYYPGWKVEVDGKPAKIYEVNLAMRGVFVPQGRHEVEYRYRPASVYAGAAMTLASVLGVYLVSVLTRKKSPAALT